MGKHCMPIKIYLYMDLSNGFGKMYQAIYLCMDLSNGFGKMYQAVLLETKYYGI